MNSSQYKYKKNELKRLCATLGCKPILVGKIVEDIELYYDEWVEKKPNKLTGEFKKYLDGEVKIRTIRPSLKELKIIQKLIKSRILEKIELPSNVHGGVKRKSNISNAKPHQGNKFIFTTDLQEFYPSIDSARVYQTLLELNFSHHFAYWITKLTTYKYQLPQGTPTSTHIANLVFLNTDRKLIELCNKHNITYTRYIDDLTFSSQKDFKLVIPQILAIVKNDSFKISYRKTFYKRNQTVTGINVFLNKIDATKEIIAKSKDEILQKAITKPYTIYVNNIRKTN